MAKVNRDYKECLHTLYPQLLLCPLPLLSPVKSQGEHCSLLYPTESLFSLFQILQANQASEGYVCNTKYWKALDPSYWIQDFRTSNPIDPWFVDILWFIFYWHFLAYLENRKLWTFGQTSLNERDLVRLVFSLNFLCFSHSVKTKNMIQTQYLCEPMINISFMVQATFGLG